MAAQPYHCLSYNVIRYLGLKRESIEKSAIVWARISLSQNHHTHLSSLTHKQSKCIEIYWLIYFNLQYRIHAHIDDLYIV